MEKQNRLATAASAYLRSAKDQPVDWQPWGEEAFAQAQREGKPVLLDIGAVWCHWCHVMDRESYENASTAALINELFVPIKVDRDERPDVDTRYQAAVAAISGQGGWPLTVFLTPDGKPYFGGTYFPPEERYGRPSFERVLRSMAAAYASQRSEVDESAASVMTAIEQNESFTGDGVALSEALLDTMIEAMLQQFDSRNGGFGSQPKFPHAAALDLLIDTANRPGPKAARARQAVEITLQRMAAGGVHDQLAGGFHRYSVDERWIVPHFEKMAYDNSELLRVYTHASQSFAQPAYAEVASKVLGWMEEHLSDREQGGFYASQDADDSLDDDGDYFTWTRAEAQEALNAGEFALAERYFALRPVGDMQHNPAKNVLHVIGDLDRIASELGLQQQEAEALLSRVRAKMLAARSLRRAPFVDKTVYTGWNGLCISAYLAASQGLRRPEATAFALKSLDRVLQAAWRPEQGLTRVVAYGESEGDPEPIPGMLEDYAYLAQAVLDAWEASGASRYLDAARQMADVLLDRFYDEQGGGFFDMPDSSGTPKIGALAARRKPLQDAPTPPGNAVAATLLLRLYVVTGESRYRDRAEQTLAAFSGLVEHLGLYAASYAQALRRFLSPPVQIYVVGDDARADTLAAAGSATFLLSKAVVRLRQLQWDSLPASLAETLPHLPGLREATVAVLCEGLSCKAPTREPGELLQQLRERAVPVAF